MLATSYRNCIICTNCPRGESKKEHASERERERGRERETDRQTGAEREGWRERDRDIEGGGGGDDLELILTFLLQTIPDYPSNPPPPPPYPSKLSFLGACSMGVFLLTLPIQIAFGMICGCPTS